MIEGDFGKMEHEDARKIMYNWNKNGRIDTQQKFGAYMIRTSPRSGMVYGMAYVPESWVYPTAIAIVKAENTGSANKPEIAVTVDTRTKNGSKSDLRVYDRSIGWFKRHVVDFFPAIDGVEYFPLRRANYANRIPNSKTSVYSRLAQPAKKYGPSYAASSDPKGDWVRYQNRRDHK